MSLFTAFQAFAQEDGWYTVASQTCLKAGQVYDAKTSSVATAEFSFSKDLTKAIKRTTSSEGATKEEAFNLVGDGQNVYITTPADPSSANENSYFFVEVSADGQAIKVYAQDFDQNACGGGTVISALHRGS